MNDIKLFAENEKELDTLILTVNIYSQDIRMEFGTENVPCQQWETRNDTWPNE